MGRIPGSSAETGSCQHQAERSSRRIKLQRTSRITPSVSISSFHIFTALPEAYHSVSILDFPLYPLMLFLEHMFAILSSLLTSNAVRNAAVITVVSVHLLSSLNVVRHLRSCLLRSIHPQKLLGILVTIGHKSSLTL
jgi:hypothetical protein